MTFLYALFVLCATLTTLHGETFFPGYRAIGTDLTLRPETFGRDVVEAVLEKLNSKCIFEKDKQMLRVLALLGSNNGDSNTTYQNGYSGGIWRVDENVFESTKSAFLQPFSSQIDRHFGINWSATRWSDLTKPLYSALAARLALSLASGETPEDFFKDSGYNSLATMQNGTKSALNPAIPWSLAGQADLWIRAFAKSGTVLQQQYIEVALRLRSSSKCKSVGADIAFIIDSSGSVSSQDFTNSLNFVVQVVNGLDIGPDRNQIAQVVYSSSATASFYLNSFTSKQQIVNKVLSTGYEGGGTATDLALMQLHSTVFTEAFGSRKKLGRPQIAVLLTDGGSNNFASTIQQAAVVHSNNITLISVGIGSINEIELKAVASDPKCRNLYYLQNYADIADIFALEIEERSCTEPAPIPVLPTDPENPDIVPKPVQIILQANEVQHLCFITTSQQGATLVINGTSGVLTVYVSFSIRRPNSANYDLKYYVEAGQVQREFLTNILIASFIGNITETTQICLTVEGGESTVGPETATTVQPWEDETGMTNDPSQIVTTESSGGNGGGGGEFNVIEGITNCGAKEYTLESGEELFITSPGFMAPDYAPGYHRKLSCQWRISVSSWSHLDLTVQYFNLVRNATTAPTAANCRNDDRVVVTTKTGIQEAKGSLCGRLAAGYFLRTKTNVSLITFTSVGDAGLGFGFSIQLKAVAKHAIACQPHQIQVKLNKDYLPRIPVAVYHLKNSPNSCGASEHGNFIQLVTAYDKCGTKAEVTNNNIYFTNEVYAEYENQSLSVVSRPYVVEIPFRCRLDRRDKPMMGVYTLTEKFFRAVGVQRPYLDGVVQVKSGLEIFVDEGFEPDSETIVDDYDFSWSRVYIETSINTGQGSPMSSQADKCWVTPTPDRDHPVNKIFIFDGCPVDSDLFVFERHESESHNDRFSIESFRFKQSASPDIYFHCIVRVCVTGLDEHLCQKSCNSRQVKSFVRSQKSTVSYVGVQRQVSSGSIDVKNAERVF